MMKRKLFALFLVVCLWVSSVAYAAEESTDFRFPVGQDISDRFHGTVYRNDLITLDATYHIPQTNLISFEPGSHSAWHVHGGMVVVGLEGTGILQIEGQPAVIIRKGDVLEIPAGVSHWHGATKDSRFQQLVIYDKNWKAPADLKVRQGMVSEEEYNNLTLEEPPGTEAPVDGFTFAAKCYESPNFTQPVYLGKVCTAPNEAGAPDYTYVFFPQGVYNKWHMHKEGQILIATDGIGLHQLKNGKVEVMRPGDVAFCPPGETHWHGASPGSSFAHIAVSPLGPHIVEWYDFKDKREYEEAMPE